MMITELCIGAWGIGAQHPPDDAEYYVEISTRWSMHNGDPSGLYVSGVTEQKREYIYTQSS